MSTWVCAWLCFAVIYRHGKVVHLTLSGAIEELLQSMKCRSTLDNALTCFLQILAQVFYHTVLFYVICSVVSKVPYQNTTGQLFTDCSQMTWWAGFISRDLLTYASLLLCLRDKLMQCMNLVWVSFSCSCPSWDNFLTTTASHHGQCEDTSQAWVECTGRILWGPGGVLATILSYWLSHREDVRIIKNYIWNRYDDLHNVSLNRAVTDALARASSQVTPKHSESLDQTCSILTSVVLKTMAFRLTTRLL